jgi:drug/metabolite transporter (DMT)-like permease
VLSGFLAAAFSVMNSRLVRRVSATAISFWEMTGAFLLVSGFLPFYSLFFTDGKGLDMALNTMDWIYITFMALVCSVFAFTMAVDLMKRISVFTVQLTLNLEPIYGMLLAIALLDEGRHMGWSFITGAGLILSAVFSYPLMKKLFT